MTQGAQRRMANGECGVVVGHDNMCSDSDVASDQVLVCVLVMGARVPLAAPEQSAMPSL